MLVLILLINGINLTTAAKNNIDVSKPKISILFFVFNKYKRNKIINNNTIVSIITLGKLLRNKFLPAYL